MEYCSTLFFSIFLGLFSGALIFGIYGSELFFMCVEMHEGSLVFIQMDKVNKREKASGEEFDSAK